MLSLTSEVREQYGVDLPFVSGSFEDAKREAQRSVRYLLLYLHSPTHENTRAFLTETLADPHLRALLTDRFVFFAASVMDPVGHRLALEMQATTFPFLAVLLRRSTVLRLKGFFAAAELLRRFQDVFDHWDGAIGAELQLRQEREDKERTRREEERRAREIESVDRERLRRFEEAERQRRARHDRDRTQREAEEEAQKAAEAEETRRAAEAARRAEAAARALARLPAEPPESAPAAEWALLSLRCPSGAQAQRRFRRTESIRALRDFAVSLGEGTEEFQLVAGYPPRALPIDTDVKIGDVPALIPRAVVLMRNV